MITIYLIFGRFEIKLIFYIQIINNYSLTFSGLILATTTLGGMLHWYDYFGNEMEDY
jgi:hypothetical protein